MKAGTPMTATQKPCQRPMASPASSVSITATGAETPRSFIVSAVTIAVTETAAPIERSMCAGHHDHHDPGREDRRDRHLHAEHREVARGQEQAVGEDLEQQRDRDQDPEQRERARALDRAEMPQGVRARAPRVRSVGRHGRRPAPWCLGGGRGVGHQFVPPVAAASTELLGDLVARPRCPPRDPGGAR